MYLQCLVGDRPTKWVEWIPWAGFCYYTSYHSALHASPFQVVYGCEPPWLQSYMAGSSQVDAVDRALIERDVALQDIRAKLQQAQHKMKTVYDKGHRDVELSRGSYVWLHLHPYCQKTLASHAYHKLAPNYYGAFAVLKHIRSVMLDLLRVIFYNLIVGAERFSDRCKDVLKIVFHSLTLSHVSLQIFSEMTMGVLIFLCVFCYGIGKQAPFIQVSRSRSLLLLVKPAVFLLAVVLGVLLHLSLFAFNALAISLLSTVSGGSESSFSKKQNISAVLLVASQKTLPVMVAVVEQLGGALGESGLLVLPCIAAHLNQIIFDSFLVNVWFQKEHELKSA
ncbi:hypothetical protein MTR67_030356 [Solanum verrucosum]|uniref:Sodium/metabolite cotransporter BASS4, chloroplastic n=1 Tax=Solanum verrucosum TaxID=315347 RepID=A0AAF0RDU5_SOLVR|nr:hypothetical protein MTR67_030356 [Solanum verrucosum]